MIKIKKRLKKFYFSSFYFTVYNEISKGKNPTQIAKNFNVSKQKINYYIKKLSSENCIKKIGYGVWEAIKPPSRKIKKEVKKLVDPHSHSFINPFSNYQSTTKTIRSHAFMFKLNFKTPPFWHLRAKVLKSLKIPFATGLNSQTTTIYGKKVIFYDKTIIVYDKTSYLSDNATKNKENAIHSFLQVVKRIENIFKVDLSYKGKYSYKVVMEHHSHINNPMAKQYAEEHKKIKFTDKWGVWGGIDNSFNLHEFEVYRNRDPNQEQPIDDIEGVSGFFNSLKETNFQATPSFLMEAINKVTQNQLIFADNMKTHISAIQTLASSVKQLESTITKLTEGGKNV